MKLISCWLVLACSLFPACLVHSQSIYAEPYTFRTLAGLAYCPGSADGTGSYARFNFPQGVAVDSLGNVFVADNGNNRIRKVTPEGVVSSLALCGSPKGIAVDNASNVLVSASGGILKIGPDGTVSTLAGSQTLGSADGTGTNAQFYGPFGVAVDGQGYVYVADTGNCTIRKITPDGTVSTLAGLAGVAGSADGIGSNAQFNHPQGVALDSAGNVYVGDSANHTIRKVTPDGTVSTLAGLALTPGSADGTGSDARFYWPRGVAVDSAGNVYVADSSSQAIRKVTPEGTVSTLAGLAPRTGSTDGTGFSARFYELRGVAVDSRGNLYVADYGNHEIRVGQVARPLLSCSRSAAQLVLSWPLETSNFVVETSSTLLPAPAWVSLASTVGTNAGSCVVTDSLAGGSRFYRLRLP